MTGPESLRALIEHTARTVAADERYPERQVTALQVLATLELADAVRSTVVELEPVDSYTESFDGPHPGPVVAMTGTFAQFGIKDEEREAWPHRRCEAAAPDSDQSCTRPVMHRGTHGNDGGRRWSA